MLGFHIGQLNVLINDTVVMSVVGEQGWEWEMAQVKLNGSQNKVSSKKRTKKTVLRLVRLVHLVMYDGAYGTLSYTVVMC